MAYLQTTCVIGTLAISASNSNALGSIIISDTMSPGPEVRVHARAWEHCERVCCSFACQAPAALHTRLRPVFLAS